MSAWSWEDYEKQHGKRAHDGQSEVPGGVQTEPQSSHRGGVSAGGGLPELPPSGGNCPGENPAPLDLNAYQVILPGKLHEGLRPFAEQRGLTVGALAINLLKIELEGGLIELTLDGEGEP